LQRGGVSMSEVAIRVANLSKRYRIGLGAYGAFRYKTLRDVLTEVAYAPFRRLRGTSRREVRNPDSEHIWALKDVSLEVQQGEVLGIIGRNGAGKTTLLKILSRVTEPTSGYAEIRGRVGSLLEVGTGFHPELTGRENIYLNGAILGMKRAEIQRKFDEIVGFAELEKFIDTPVKRYSSGMYMRLAFSVAAHLESEILLVDEVLAVGDASFQKKCLGKMGDAAREGRTVLFVSHNMTAVRSLCSNCSLLEGGHLAFSGSVGECIDRYLSEFGGDNPSEVYTESLPRPSVVADTSLRILRVKLDTGNRQAMVRSAQPLVVEMGFRSSRPLADVVFGITVDSVDNIRILDCRSTDTFTPIRELLPGRYSIRCAIEQNILAPGLYRLSVGARCASKGLEYLPHVLTFEVQEVDRYESLWLEVPSGFVRVRSNWSSPEEA